MAETLVLIDVQRNMLLPPTPVPAAALVGPALADLLTRARIAGAAVVHVRNNGGAGEPDETGTTGWELVHDVVADERIVDKHEPDAFAGTTLDELVPPDGTVVLAGMQSEHCIRSTALSALRRGHRVIVAGGAHATYDDGASAEDISASVERELAVAGVTVCHHDEIVFERAG